VLRLIYGIYPLSQEDTLALAQKLRLNYENRPKLSFFVLKSYEVFDLIGEKPCLGKEFEIVRKLLFHLDQVPGQIVLASDLKHAWKVVNFVIGLQLLEFFSWWSGVCPPNVPIQVVFGRQPPAHLLFGDFFNHIVHGVYRV
jgi:hypothetical protein